VAGCVLNPLNLARLGTVILVSGFLKPRMLLSIHRGIMEAATKLGIDFAAQMLLSCNKFIPICAASEFNVNNSDKSEREAGNHFMPKFDGAGLLTAVIQDASSHQILMVGFMDEEALAKTRATGLAHFHSRSRGVLWCKGETSGNVLRVKSIMVDCDQDALVLTCEAAGPTCHTGVTSCFYRELKDGQLVRL